MTEKVNITPFAINYFGSGGHPVATADNLHEFTIKYKRHCLRKLLKSSASTDEAKDLAKAALEQLKT